MTNSEVENEIIKENEEPEKTTEEKPSTEWLDLLGSGSIMKKILHKGQDSSLPQRLQKCCLNYILTYNEEIVETKENFEIQLGDCEVIQGLDVAVGLMNVGEKCLLQIKSRLAFGQVGLPPKIPPNATVQYEVELVSVKDEESLEALSVAQRKAEGNKKKERGNWWYGRGENSLAIQCYRRALDYLDEVEGGISDPSVGSPSDSDLQDLLEDRISVNNNMAAAQIKLELYDKALTSLQTVLRCQPNNLKALFRKAKVHRAKNDLTAAAKCLKKAEEIAPNDPDVQKEMLQISKIVLKHKETEKLLARRMFGESISQKKEKTKTTNFLLWSATMVASFAVAMVGVAAYRFKYT